MSAPLPEIDAAAVAAYWDCVLDDGAVAAGTPQPDAVGPFGDSVELADELLGLVLDGRKRATAGALAQYRHHGEPIPSTGDLWVVTDGRGAPRAVVRTTEVRVGSLDSVDDAFARDEGEGDRSRAGWLAAHEAFFRRDLARIGAPWTPGMATVFERFELVHVAHPAR